MSLLLVNHYIITWRRRCIEILKLAQWGNHPESLNTRNTQIDTPFTYILHLSSSIEVPILDIMPSKSFILIKWVVSTVISDLCLVLTCRLWWLHLCISITFHTRTACTPSKENLKCAILVMWCVECMTMSLINMQQGALLICRTVNLSVYLNSVTRFCCFLTTII